MTKTATLQIEGMSCQNCVRHVTRALKSVPGVEAKEVAIGSALVEYDAAAEQPMLDALREAGFPATVRE